MVHGETVPLHKTGSLCGPASCVWFTWSIIFFVSHSICPTFFLSRRPILGPTRGKSFRIRLSGVNLPLSKENFGDNKHQSTHLERSVNVDCFNDNNFDNGINYKSTIQLLKLQSRLKLRSHFQYYLPYLRHYQCTS